MVKIYLDPGHGGSDPGASANGLLEKNITLKIALQLEKILKESYKNASVRLSRTSDRTRSLKQRTDDANQWGADYLLSIHINAGGGTGFESYIWNGRYDQKQNTDRLRELVHEAIVEEVDWQDRGKKEANFHMLRESKMPAVLTENGFLDNPADAKTMRTTTWVTNVANAHALGLEKALHLKKKSQSSQPSKTIFYRVICGSFQSERNAKQRVYVLSKRGYQSFISVYHEGGKAYYRVVTGSFQQKKNAESRVKQLSGEGFACFITSYED